MSHQKMPDLIKLYIKSCAIGFVLAAVFVGLVLWFDVAGLGHLIAGSDIGVMAVIVFWVLNGIVFAGVQFAIAVMGMAEDDDDDDPRGGRMMPVFLAEPIPVRVSDRKDRRRFRQ
ncbi:hypothetical protein L0664_03025 [Octadecabacter sp. G9-8]|uniref:Uncharacterized protein n=1 Tax=Octadecabacter dasysiphoniae TaxID=2909341 RepID=A0ABS9CUC7_9RHOB|nr:hypothetical protein [Octadecabacter dasysiphoniae]MCF2870030.1 hypothetical protein [Octadecabacter dasysiphoniae]